MLPMESPTAVLQPRGAYVRAQGGYAPYIIQQPSPYQAQHLVAAAPPPYPMSYPARQRPQQPALQTVPSYRVVQPPKANGVQQAVVQAGLEAMYFCGDLRDWLQPEASRYRGLCMARPKLIARDKYQEAADKFTTSLDERHTDLEECVDLARARVSPGGVRAEAAKVAQGLFGDLDLPQDLIEQIKADAVQLSDIMSELCPTAQHVDMKLESFGIVRCANWHQDRYAARAMVTYCGAGTEYAEDSNVDFLAMQRLLELARAGRSTEQDNSRIIKDPTMIKSVSAGDMILIKGDKFPDRSGGLVHKSPEVEYHPDGRVKHRLCLKVDVSDFKQGLSARR
eukprot:TRINITY_DN17421_c0_g1_i1.p1 TRINITY_DN17421_c0_g1~~TRINITY_DN17421_c0_g1_i1.p1  ORF type:complete len:338 (+),score=47.67 TRINITY_DN17421_c0_g1_i1:37-1050(+)